MGGTDVNLNYSGTPHEKKMDLVWSDLERQLEKAFQAEDTAQAKVQRWDREEGDKKPEESLPVTRGT